MAGWTSPKDLPRIGSAATWTWRRPGKPSLKLLPRNLTWNLKMMVSKRNLLFQGLLFRFMLNFRGVTARGPENSRNPKRKGSSPHHHFAGIMLAFGSALSFIWKSCSHCSTNGFRSKLLFIPCATGMVINPKVGIFLNHYKDSLLRVGRPSPTKGD